MDAFLAALNLLASRELSESQVRHRLARRQHAPDDIDAAVGRLKIEGTLNDRRVALAAARLESAIRHRGRARVMQKLRQIGIEDSVAQDAVDEVFREVDEDALLDRACARRIRGQSIRALDEKGRARLIRGLVAQGFSIDAVLKRFRA